ncbi:MAG: phosphoribosylformylglycinamidine synthase [Chloroflexi bacterium]|nr:phosphoribosylformylglycinamidine synthase [Chloroflexota bacterium]|tara:strand:- start:2520 stop:2771 length:252 start_codon:yes stop_codon:yes gene_type:complete
MFLVKVQVKLKSTVNDPEGQTILEALHRLDHKQIDSLRSGKYFEININGNEEEEVAKIVENICDNVITNPLIETYSYEITSKA